MNDLEMRMKAYQENVNKKVLIDWVRITGLPNPRRRKLDVLLNDFAQDIVKYPISHGMAFYWPSPAGFYGNQMAIRARMSYDFWKHFISEGRKALYEYNKSHGTDIKINREKTMPITEQERLGLFIRKKIRDIHMSKGLRSPDVTLKKGMLKIGENEAVKPAIAVVLLNLDMTKWHGLPPESLLSDDEKDLIEKGSIKRGSLTILDDILGKDVEKNVVIEENETNGM